MDYRRIANVLRESNRHLWDERHHSAVIPFDDTMINLRVYNMAVPNDAREAMEP